jgi:signal transduction histidine kinase/CheY-like chemotaxis protein
MGLADRNSRVLIFAPVGRDASATADLLRRTGQKVTVCGNIAELTSALDASVAAVFVAEEGLFGQNIGDLSAWVDAQPPWSDLPFIVLTSHQEQPAVTEWRRKLIASLCNVSLLERPVQAITLTSTVKAAVRARMRQYQVRGLLEAQERSGQELEALVAKRTSELETANSELQKQMTEKARVEDTLRQSQKLEAVGQLTGGVAHDFNNLLMVISGGLEMLDRPSDSGRRQLILDGMRQAAQRGAVLTRQLLGFSRKQKLRPEPVDLTRQLTRMGELLERSLRGDVHVTFEFAENLWPVEVDPGELQLMVLNLAVNARDAMPNGGTIIFHAENLPGRTDSGLSADFVRLCISDTGMGMSEEVKSHIFEPFFTTKDVGKGSGLGLAQVHGFATQSGGTVRIETEIGRGTTVIVLLPRSAKAAEPVPVNFVDMQVAPPPAQFSGCVLLVEDDDEVGTLVGEMLDQLGYKVKRAGCASGALEALASGESVDIVFSDIMMPGGMNGVQLAREIRNRRPHLPVLLTSGYAEAATQSAEAEGLCILPKPYGREELASALKAAMEGSQLRAP